jgi:superfamily II DNA or RNA helicase
MDRSKRQSESARRHDSRSSGLRLTLGAVSSPWAGYAAGVTFRAYQSAALERFESLLATGQRRFYLVAPPGSGKTLLGLSIAAQLEAPALVLSPSA